MAQRFRQPEWVFPTNPSVQLVSSMLQSLLKSDLFEFAQNVLRISVVRRGMLKNIILRYVQTEMHFIQSGSESVTRVSLGEALDGLRKIMYKRRDIIMQRSCQRFPDTLRDAHVQVQAISHRGVGPTTTTFALSREIRPGPNSARCMMCANSITYTTSVCTKCNAKYHPGCRLMAESTFKMSPLRPQKCISCELSHCLKHNCLGTHLSGLHPNTPANSTGNNPFEIKHWAKIMQFSEARGLRSLRATTSPTARHSERLRIPGSDKTAIYLVCFIFCHCSCFSC